MPELPGKYTRAVASLADMTALDTPITNRDSVSPTPSGGARPTKESVQSSPDPQERQALSHSTHSSASSVSSTWSCHSTLDNPSEAHMTAAQSVAVALRGFATGAKILTNEEESEFGRPRVSRESSLHSENSWSSARSDEVSEGSIRYPTTVSLVDRMMAMRIPAPTQDVDMRVSTPANVPPSFSVDHPDHPTTADSEESCDQSSAKLSPAILLAASPPPRPVKNRLRSQQSEETAQIPSSPGSPEAQEGSVFSNTDGKREDEIEPVRTEIQPHSPTAATRQEESDLQKDGATDTLSVMTRESNPFEFGISASAASTPSVVCTLTTNPPVSELPASPNLQHMAQTSDTHRTTENMGSRSSPDLMPTPKAASGSLGVARELANRFSTASDILRKHHVDDVGVQSYFPVVADEEARMLEEQAADVSSAFPETELQIEHASPEQTRELNDHAAEATADVASGALSNPVILGSAITNMADTTALGDRDRRSTRDESNGGWNILDDYVEGDTSSEARSPVHLHDSRSSNSVLGDVTSTVNNKQMNAAHPDNLKKKPSGILKIRTAINSPQSQQNENSPQAVRTPTHAQTFQYGSSERSMSPDTKRFRGFAMHFASPSGTPTKSGSKATPRVISSSFGQKSAEATKLVQEDTLHGQLAIDLASARNPVPIAFLLGQPTSSPQLDANADHTPQSMQNGTPPQHRSATSPSPIYCKHSPKAPSSPFFPFTSDKPRSRSFSAVEVPLPMHRSDSSTSLQVAYAGLLQNGQVPERQQKAEHEGGMRRSLSRSGTGKLSAIRRKLSLKSDQRPDLSAVLSDNQQPPLPDTPSMRSRNTGHEDHQIKDAPSSSERTGADRRTLKPDSPTTPTTKLTDGKAKLSQWSMRSTSIQDLKPVSHIDQSPIVKVAGKNFAMDIPTNGSFEVVSANTSAPLYDEYGYLASHSPVPQSFATIRASEKEVSKLEQTLVCGPSSCFHTESV